MALSRNVNVVATIAGGIASTAFGFWFNSVAAFLFMTGLMMFILKIANGLKEETDRWTRSD